MEENQTTSSQESTQQDIPSNHEPSKKSNKKLFVIFLVVIIIGLLLTIFIRNYPSRPDASPDYLYTNNDIMGIPINGEEKTNDIDKKDSEFKQLIIQGETRANEGMGDPSIEYDSQGIGWLTYTAIHNTYLSTHLARSDDHGATWVYEMEINSAPNNTVNGNAGKWANEVSTIVYHPEDTGREWKIFWHRYFRTDEKRDFGAGWIAYKYASLPTGPWSEQKRLFGARPYNGPKFIPDTTQFPLDPEEGIYLNNLHADLKPYVGYSEPGTIVVNGKLYMSLEGGLSPTEDFNKRGVFLLSYDHNNRRWKYETMLAITPDAVALGFEEFTASSLAKAGNKYLLLLSPRRTKEINKYSYLGHDGTMVFEFENTGANPWLLKRDEDGKLLYIHYKLADPVNTKGGQSDYDEQNTNGGMLMHVVTLPQPGIPRFFRIFNINTNAQF